MNLNNLDNSQIMKEINAATDEMQNRITSKIITEQEYKNQLENCIFETCDILHELQEDSEKESKLNRKRFIIQTWISAFALLAAVVAAVAAIIALL